MTPCKGFAFATQGQAGAFSAALKGPDHALMRRTAAGPAGSSGTNDTRAAFCRQGCGHIFTASVRL